MKYTMTERNKKWVSSFSGFGYNRFVGGQDYGLNISSTEAGCRLYVSYMSANCRLNVSYMPVNCRLYVSYMTANCRLNVSYLSAICRFYVSYMSDVSYRADMISCAVILHQPCLVQGRL